jgi:hypothetical protein
MMMKYITSESVFYSMEMYRCNTFLSSKRGNLGKEYKSTFLKMLNAGIGVETPEFY